MGKETGSLNFLNARRYAMGEHKLMMVNKIDYSAIFNYWQQLLGRYCWKLGFKFNRNRYRFEPIVYHQSYDTRHFNGSKWPDMSTKVPTWLGWEYLLPNDRINCKRLNSYFLEHTETHNMFVAKLDSRPNARNFIQLEELALKKMLGVKLKKLKQMVVEDFADCAARGSAVYANLNDVVKTSFRSRTIELMHENESLEELMIKIALTA